MTDTAPVFAARTTTAEIEQGLTFTPKFDAEGYIPAIASDHRTGEVVMFAFMNRQALALTIETGVAHFWSRSRNRLWKKGEESGNFLRLRELRTDCDQDVVWMRVEVAGNGVACHTGARSCFYRSIPLGQAGASAIRLENA